MNEYDAARVWDRLPAEMRHRLARLVDDAPKAAQLVSLLDNMAATINAAEHEGAQGVAGDVDDDATTPDHE